MLARLKPDAGARIPRGANHETQRLIDRHAHTHTHTIHAPTAKPRFHTHKSPPPPSEPNLARTLKRPWPIARRRPLARRSGGSSTTSRYSGDPAVGTGNQPRFSRQAAGLNRLQRLGIATRVRRVPNHCENRPPQTDAAWHAPQQATARANVRASAMAQKHCRSGSATSAGSAFDRTSPL